MDTSLQSIGDVAIGQGNAAAVGQSLKGSRLDKAANDFEGMFMSQMLQPMFDGIGADPMFGGGHGEEAMKSFMIQEYGKIIAKNGHLGLTPAVRNEMIMAQAKAGGASATATAATAAPSNGEDNAVIQ